MELIKNSLYIHKDGGVYRLTEDEAEVKLDTSEWVPAVMYEDIATGKKYIRTVGGEKGFKASFQIYTDDNRDMGEQPTTRL